MEELIHTKQELISSKSPKKNNTPSTTDKEALLCNHCKRTSSNGIRCLGMCVADNDY